MKNLWKSGIIRCERTTGTIHGITYAPTLATGSKSDIFLFTIFNIYLFNDKSTYIEALPYALYLLKDLQIVHW